MLWKLLLSIPGIGRVKRVVDDLFQRLKNLENVFHLFEYRVDQIYRNVVTALMANQAPVLNLNSALKPGNILSLREVLFQETEAVRLSDVELENEPDPRFSEPLTAADIAYMAANRRRLQVTFDMLSSLRQSKGDFMAVADLATCPVYHPGLRACFPASKLIFLGSAPGNLSSLQVGGDVNWVPGFDLETAAIPLPEGSVDLVLCLEVLEHLMFDPMHVLGEINRILKMGGMLLLSTPNLASWKAAVGILTGCSPLSYGKFSKARQLGSMHVREWTPNEIEVLFKAAGLDPMLTTQNAYHTATPETIRGILQAAGVSNRLSGDTIFALGTKSGEVMDRYPSQFYD
jgi:hypothetical protein